jgi:hypothetical protein
MLEYFIVNKIITKKISIHSSVYIYISIGYISNLSVSIYPSIYLYVCLSVYLSIFLPACAFLFVFLYVYLSICLCINLYSCHFRGLTLSSGNKDESYACTRNQCMCIWPEGSPLQAVTAYRCLVAWFQLNSLNEHWFLCGLFYEDVSISEWQILVNNWLERVWRKAFMA